MSGLPPHFPRLGVGQVPKPPRRRPLYSTRRSISPSPYWSREPTAGQRQLNPVRPLPTIADTVGPRFPNYLPELHAKRAELVSRQNSRARRRKAQNPTRITPRQDLNLGEIIERNILTDLVNLCDTSDIIFGYGHPTYGPRPIPLNHMATFSASAYSLTSLWRAPNTSIRAWEDTDLDSPLLQVALMRRGEGVGPTGSQLPTPESSHDVGLSIRGHRRHSNSSRTRHEA